MDESYVYIDSNVQSTLRAFSMPDEQRAYSIISESRWFTLRTMNILFKVLDIQVATFEMINRLVDNGSLLKYEGIYDTYYDVNQDFGDQGIDINRI